MNRLKVNVQKKYLLFAIAALVAITSVVFFSRLPERRVILEGIEVDISILRLDKDLFTVDIDSIPDHLPWLERKYGDFFEIFNNLIIRIGSSTSPSYSQNLHRFLTDRDIYQLRLEVEKVFPSLDELEEELEEAFRHYLYYFPSSEVPQVYTYLSGFNQSLVIADSILAIGLDKYLGSDHEFYARLQLPMFQRSGMHPEKIISDCMIGWATTEFAFDNRDDNLLANMIYHGKLLYFADRVLPDHHDTLKTGFSLRQLEWCRSNERVMWTYLVENKLLFSTDRVTIDKFINDGPFTSGFPRDSPARAVVWLGWQIVDSYMNRNREVTLKDLMIDAEYQQILNKARYRP